MGSRMATLKDVAAAAGVSRTTASNAYNRPGRLSAAVQARILAAARELGYPGPDPVARSLRTGRVGTVGVLLAEALTFAFDDPAAVLLLREIAEASQLADIGLSLLPAPPERPTGTAALTHALARAAVPIQECGVPNRASGYAGATALLERAPELTAILATTDLLALGAVEAARQRDLPVAGALSIVGFDDLPDAAGAELTTVHQPLTGKGRIAAHMLQQALDGAAVIPSRVELSTRLIVRASTGRPTSKSPL